MKLQQLRYIWEVSRHDLNVSQAALSLFTSQPGVSKQIRALEKELGVEIFSRNGKQLTSITPAGEAILSTAKDVIRNIETIKAIAGEFADERRGSLSIATTHTQSRYVLPPIINRFITKYPDVSLHMHQGTPMQMSELAANGITHFVIATEAIELFGNLIMLPCYRWNRIILVPRDHPLTLEPRISLEGLASYPIVTYTSGFTGRSKLDEAFKAIGLAPKVVFTASDADVIKTYVRLGLGIGIVAKMAYDPLNDEELQALDVSHLFEPSITRIGFRRDSYIRGYMYDFINMFAPHLTREVIKEALECSTSKELEQLFSLSQLPEL